MGEGSLMLPHTRKYWPSKSLPIEWPLLLVWGIIGIPFSSVTRGGPVWGNMTPYMLSCSGVPGATWGLEDPPLLCKLGPDFLSQSEPKHWPLIKCILKLFVYISLKFLPLFPEGPYWGPSCYRVTTAAMLCPLKKIIFCWYKNGALNGKGDGLAQCLAFHQLHIIGVEQLHMVLVCGLQRSPPLGLMWWWPPMGCRWQSRGTRVMILQQMSSIFWEIIEVLFF